MEEKTDLNGRTNNSDTSRVWDINFIHWKATKQRLRFGQHTPIRPI